MIDRMVFSMHTMMLVDDEELSRYAFKTLVSRNFDDIEVIAEAETGMEALELYRKLIPDIVVMDIKIPGMNGLETLRRILEEYPHANILVCSAYDSFSYISQAMDLGVKGYLLKPVKKEEAIEKLQRILGERRSPLDALAERSAVRLMVTGALSAGMLLDLEGFYGRSIRNGTLVAFTVKKGSLDDAEECVGRLLRKLVPRRGCVLTGLLGKRIVTYISSAEKDGFATSKRWADLVVRWAENEKNIGILSQCEPVTEGNWVEAWQRLSIANAEKFGSTEKYSNAEKPVSAENTVKGSKAVADKLLEHLRVGDGAAVMNALDDWISIVFENEYNIALTESLQLLSLMRHQLEKQGIVSDGFDILDVIAEASGQRERDLLEIMLRNQTAAIVRQMEKLRGKRTSLLKNIYDMLSNDELKNISLDGVALQLGISPQYLCRAFKDEMGVNFLEYVTERRLKYACELLKNSAKPLRDIAFLCGYNDTAYFTRLFKKTIGITPAEYRTDSN